MHLGNGLNQLTQRHKVQQPKFTHKNIGEDHLPVWVVTVNFKDNDGGKFNAQVKSSNKKAAEQDASKMVLNECSQKNSLPPASYDMILSEVKARHQPADDFDGDDSLMEDVVKRPSNVHKMIAALELLADHTKKCYNSIFEALFSDDTPEGRTLAVKEALADRKSYDAGYSDAVAKIDYLK